MTPRAVILGVLWVLGICIGGNYSNYMVGSSEPTWSHFPSSVGCPFVFLVLFNALLRRFARRWALEAGELIVMLVMGLVVTGIPVFISGSLMALISAPYYSATPENGWEGLIQPFLPSFGIPQPEGDALRWFWEGLPAGQSIPFEIWLGPLFWWLSLILTVYFVCFCLTVILRRQWEESERLVFPLAELPRALLASEEEGAGRSILALPSFWIGFGLSLLMVCFSTIRYFQPGFPDLAIWEGTTLSPGYGFPALDLRIVPPILAFMFLTKTSISFSIWFFYLVAVLQEGITNRIGYDVTSPDAFVWGMQSLSWQGWGAFLAMVLWSLWMARGHLRGVFRQAFTGVRVYDDSMEMMSYRVAVYGLLGGFLYIVAWLVAAGLNPLPALLFTVTVIIIYLGMTRLVIQTGMYYLTTPVNAQAFTTAILGTHIGSASLVTLGMQYGWHGDVQSVFMPSAAHAARLDYVARGARRMGLAIGLAVLVGFGSAIWYLLYMSYTYGASNLRDWYFAGGSGIARMAVSGVIRQISTAAGTDWGKLFHAGIGAVSYSLLALGHYRFYWWPLHPVGLAVAPLWMTRLCAFSVFVAWLSKSVLLRYGGITAYRRARPFFIGQAAGFFLGVGVSFGVDVIWFYGYGHGVPW